MAKTTTPTVTIRTNFTPPITINPLQKTEVKKGFSFISVIQPSIDMDLPIVGVNHYAPYGEPTGFGLAFLVAVVALAMYGTYKLIS